MCVGWRDDIRPGFVSSEPHYWPLSTTDASTTAMPPKRALHPLPVLDEPSLLSYLDANKIPREHARRLWQKLCQGAGEPDVPNLPKRLREALGPANIDASGLGRAIDRTPQVARVEAPQAVPEGGYKFRTLTSRLVSATPASDNSTTKLLIQLQDGHLVEAVLIRYGQVEIRSMPESVREESKKKAESKRNASVKRNDSIASHDMDEQSDRASLASTSKSRNPNLLAFPSAPRVHTSNPRLTLCISSQIGCRMACTFCATGTMGLLGELWAGEMLEQVVWGQWVEGERIRNGKR